ncbi:MAG: shikimate dehydrogenase, partial [Actinomycetota bacterium]|nr:shikimate dehydrogenase [Actinomycetota bacterium]
DWVFVAFDVPAGEGEAAVRAVRTLGLTGMSVTMPHKADAARACDELTPDAAALGAVNSVRLTEGGRLVGDSTDGEGFRRALIEAGHDPAGRRVLVLGAGGAARAVVLALGRVGCDVTVAARRVEAAAAAASLAPGGRTVEWASLEAMVQAADVIVQATPIGMDGAGGGATPFDPELLRPGQVVADLVYHPLETPLLAATRARGAAAVDGLGMLVHQAGLQVERWTGRPAPIPAMFAAARSQLG